MEKVIVEQFNPINGYWNKLYEVDKESFDSDEPITVNKYNGPYRTRIVGKAVVEEVAEVIIEEEVVEEVVSKKDKPKKKFYQSFVNGDQD